MTPSLRLLGWTLVLALAQVLVAAGFKRCQDGYMWAAGSRDAPPPPYKGLAGRLARAQSNLFETLPVFVGAVLIAHVAGRESAAELWGARLYFWARLLFVPTYMSGVVMVRSLIWTVSFAGLVLVLGAVLLS